ncbi:MAG: helix-turn-helix domain-containing protein [Deltaproteobacteria bacterium]|nr:helix-turn-helix domain-containing protein [Deltaproteobacteria bacterium]
MTATQLTEMELPREEERERARDALCELSRLRPGRVVHVRSDEAGSPVDVVLPARIFDALLELLRQTAQGNAVTLVPVHAELTTQQAADVLNVSRPHLIKLLESGALPFHRTGRHRRVYAEDLLAYRDRRRQQSRDAFEELAALSQDHDLGY